ELTVEDIFNYDTHTELTELVCRYQRVMTSPTMSKASPDEWQEVARTYAGYTPPLRPSSNDLRRYEQLLADFIATGSIRSSTVLLLGVTPDVVGMKWPPATRLLAVDSSQSMIQALWPKDNDSARVVCADWRQLPFRKASFQAVMGDGVLNTVRYPADV